MNPSTVAPLIGAIALAIAVTGIHRRLPPALATRAVATTMVVVVIAAIPTMWLTTFAFLAHSPLADSGFAWCAKAFGVHHQPVPTGLGVASAFVAVVGTWRAIRAVRTHRQLAMIIRARSKYSATTSRSRSRCLAVAGTLSCRVR